MDTPGEMRIGDVLRGARERAGLDLHEIEEQTKIRRKYLAALEDEEWEELPSPAYAKGFLRTYADSLGLDSEALVDEFRRQVETGDASSASYPLGDQVLESRRRFGGRERGSRAGLWVGIAAVVVAAVVVVLALTDDDGGERGRRGEPRADQRGDGRGGGGGKDKPAPGERTVTLALSTIEPIEVCLLGGHGQELIDGQVLAAGTEDSWERKRFELRFPRGFDGEQLRLELDGKRRLLPRVEGPAAFEIVAPQRLRPAPAPSKKCP